MREEKCCCEAQTRKYLSVAELPLMHRFYFPHSDFSTKDIVLTDQEEIHHLQNVLRLKKGAEVSLFNGIGDEGMGVIGSITRTKVLITIQSVAHLKRPQPRIILACSLPKKSKFEWIIEKATELGVQEIIPLQTERTEIILKGEKEHKKIERFEQVAINACKQSQYPFLPEIHGAMDTFEAVDFLMNHSVVLMPSLQGDRKPLVPILQHHAGNRPISFMIGPEGDFTDEEYRYAHSQGCVPISLGPTILKVETAAITAVACAHQILTYHGFALD